MISEIDALGYAKRAQLLFYERIIAGAGEA
jgi:hypothetical protein